jgi:hypothetical protein
MCDLQGEWELGATCRYNHINISLPLASAMEWEATILATLKSLLIHLIIGESHDPVGPSPIYARNDNS